MAFANVVDSDGEPISCVLHGEIASNLMDDRFSSGKRFYFIPDFPKIIDQITDLLIVKDDWAINRPVKAGSIGLKIPEGFKAEGFKAPDRADGRILYSEKSFLDNPKGSFASITLTPGAYWNNDTKKAGIFLKVDKIE